jgi:hypothetical protein
VIVNRRKRHGVKKEYSSVILSLFVLSVTRSQSRARSFYSARGHVQTSRRREPLNDTAAQGNPIGDNDAFNSRERSLANDGEEKKSLENERCICLNFKIGKN